MIIALELLYRSSNINNGIAASSQDLHYLWTYGPTAILTVIITLWSRAEFQAKQSAPWQAMLKSPQPADQSVLLDYISDMQPVAIWNSLKNRHFSVSSAVSCSLLLRLLIIFSTSLFSLKEVRVQKLNVPIQVHDKFSAEDSALGKIGSKPYDILNGIMFENVTYPMGANVNLTFQEFSAPNLSSDAVITAPIEGLLADFDCEDAVLDVRSLSYVKADTTAHASSDYDVGISSPSCEIAEIPVIGDLEGPTASFQGAHCKDMSSSDGYRIVLTMIQPYQKNVTSIQPPAGHRHDGSTGWKRVYLGLTRSISLICKPKLSLLKLQAEGNGTESSSEIDIRIIGSEDANLPGITAGDIAEIIVKNSTTTTGFRAIEDDMEFHHYAEINFSFHLGLYLIGANVTVDNLWEDGVLQNSALAFYRAISALLMHMGLVQKDDSTAVGSAMVKEHRVVMVELPLRGMEVCLSLCILLTICMIVTLPIDPIATWNAGYICSIAAVVANSTTLRSSLSGTGLISHKKLQHHLVGKEYSTRETIKGTSIEIMDSCRRASQLKTEFRSKYHPWKPFPALIGRIIIFILVLAAIAVLEALLHISQRNDGLGDASSGDDYQHYLWTIVPALIMVGISLLFGSIDFNIRCLAPYAPLSRPKGVIFERSMSLNFLDSLGLMNSFRSITSRHFAVQATTLATSAAFFLTIITSGLYSVVEVPLQTKVNFTRVGGFPDPRTIAGPQRLMSESKEVEGILFADYIFQYNFSYPRWTYKDLAFAQISVGDVSDEKLLNSSTFVDVKVPALRLAPVCHQYTPAELQASFGFYDGDQTAGSYYVYVNQTRMACPGSSANGHGNLSVTSIQNLSPQPFGKSFESQCNYDTANSGVAVGSSHYTISYIWGYFNSSSLQHITGLYCIQYAETVDVWTRFLLPNMDIDENYPPAPDESSAKLAPDLYTPIPEWWILNSNGKYPKFDGFFQDLTSGKYAISVDNFKSGENDQTVIDAIKNQHKIITAQQFNNYTRGTSNDSIEHSLLYGNVTTSNRLRVVQDIPSTRILEGLLGFILALGILGSVLLNTDHVLPKNPCSIAAVSSLLADSRFLEEFLEGLWEPGDEKLKQTFSNHTFHLGWWESGERVGAESEEKLFTIDHRPTEKEGPFG